MRRHPRARAWLIVPLSLTGLSLAHCHSSTPAQPTSGAAMPPPTLATAYPPPTSPTSTPPPTPTAPTTAPFPTSTPPAGGQAIAINPATAQAATVVLSGLAAQQLPAGMTPEGAPFAGQFTEGQTLSQPLTLKPGKCYSIVAAGAGISEIHIAVQAPPLPGAIAQDTGAPGPTAIMGDRAADCWRNALPLAPTVQVVITATHGSGIGVAQVYVK